MKSILQSFFVPNQEGNDKSGPVEEYIIWSGRPSQVVNLSSYVILAVVFVASVWLCLKLNLFCIIISIYSLVRMVYIYLKVRYILYTFTNQRIKVRTGILSRITKEIELYRIKDVHLFEPFILRLFKKGDIRLVSSQKTSSVFMIPAVDNPEQLREKIRFNVERRRSEKGVGELDTGL